MHGVMKSGCLAIVAVLCLIGQASAGILAAAANDEAIAGWKGTRTMTGPVVGTHYVNALVDFAVFAPGDFQDFLDDPDDNPITINPISYSDPSGGTEVVYAFQIFNGDSNPYLTNITAGIDASDPVNNVAWITGTGMRTPSGNTFPGTSIRWNFATSATRINDNQSSLILLYTSPRLPEWDHGQTGTGISSGLSAGRPDFPSPGPVDAPEPGTFALGFLGLMVLGLAKYFRRRA